jgi:hypothetical protein
MEEERIRRTSRRSGETPTEGLPDRFAFSTGGSRRQSAAKKTTAKSAAKPAAKKTTAKKTTAKSAAKPTAKKTTAKKTTAKKTTAKAPAKKTTAKPAAKKTTAKTAAKKTTAKKTTAKKTTAKTAARRGPEAAAAATAVAEAPAAAPPEEETETFAAVTREPPAPPAPTRVAAPPRPAPPVTPPPPAEPEVYRRRRLVLAGVAVAVVAALIWGIVYLVGRDGSETTAPPTPGQTTPTTPTSPTGTIPTTTAEAAFPGTAEADTGSLQVVPLGSRDEKCTTNTVGGNSAYLSNCSDWEEQADVLYFFYITLENKTAENLSWKRNFFSVTSGSTDLEPIEVRKQAAAPTTFLPRSGRIPAQGSISGYLVFETDGQFDPASLKYLRGDLSLTIQFEGPREEVPAG